MLADAAASGTDRLRFPRHIDRQLAESAYVFASGRVRETQAFQIGFAA